MTESLAVRRNCPNPFSAESRSPAIRLRRDWANAFSEGVPAVGPLEVEAPSRFAGRVLVVDDEPVIMETTAAILVSLGLTVVTASDGQEAVEKFEADTNGFDLVLMDLTMPRMNGHEALNRMRALRADVPILLCSGFSEQEMLPELQELGATGFLQKPFILSELKNAIHARLGK